MADRLVEKTILGQFDETTEVLAGGLPASL